MFSKSNASRKFTDLIYESSSSFANWEPAKIIQIGDYGKIDSSTGQMKREGNIYTSECEEIQSLAARYQPVVAKSVVERIISSIRARHVNLGGGPRVGFAGVAEAGFNAEWNFSKGRGAFLVMHNSRLTHIPDEFLRAAKSLTELKGKDLVVETHSCPAYAMYLSSGSDQTVGLQLNASIPIAALAGVSVGGQTQIGWSMSGGSGTSQNAYEFEECFVPLIRLKTIKPRGLLRRQSPDPQGEEDEVWMDTEPPWTLGRLDEDGGTASSDSEEEEEEADSEFGDDGF